MRRWSSQSCELRRPERTAEVLEMVMTAGVKVVERIVFVRDRRFVFKQLEGSFLFLSLWGLEGVRGLLVCTFFGC